MSNRPPLHYMLDFIKSKCPKPANIFTKPFKMFVLTESENHQDKKIQKFLELTQKVCDECSTRKPVKGTLCDCSCHGGIKPVLTQVSKNTRQTEVSIEPSNDAIQSDQIHQEAEAEYTDQLRIDVKPVSTVSVKPPTSKYGIQTAQIPQEADAEYTDRSFGEDVILENTTFSDHSSDDERSKKQIFTENPASLIDLRPAANRRPIMIAADSTMKSYRSSDASSEESVYDMIVKTREENEIAGPSALPQQEKKTNKVIRSVTFNVNDRKENVDHNGRGIKKRKMEKPSSFIDHRRPTVNGIPVVTTQTSQPNVHSSDESSGETSDDTQDESIHELESTDEGD